MNTSAQSSLGSGKDQTEVSNNFSILDATIGCEGLPQEPVTYYSTRAGGDHLKRYGTVLVMKVLQLMTKLCKNYFMSFRRTMSSLRIRKSSNAKRIVMLDDCSDSSIPREKIYRDFIAL